MCGIAGIISKNQQLTTIHRMQPAVRCLQHRGPDGTGTWTNPEHTIILGHRRLSIIDLSSAGAQPMAYAGRYSIVHNGELYNYLELKQLLEQKGYRFNSSSDTEVIVAAYDAYGTDCLNRFDGMFAFAIWDQQAQKLFAAKDRFGEKPFFFYFDEEQLLFASEIKALHQLGVPKEVNYALLYNFLTIGYTTNPADPQETFYQHIYKLPASSFLIYDLASHTLEQERYGQIFPETDTVITEESAIEKFTYLLKESIKKRMRSDVAIGTSLSGGLDSSTIVAFCSKLQSDQYSHKCFTAAFPGFERDEQRYAATVARQFHLDQIMVETSSDDLIALMDKVMLQQEEPVGSASVLAQYRVYEAAKQHGVTVLLDGQGADEILAGYHKYYKWYWQELYRGKKLGKSKELEQARAIGIKDSFGLRNKAAALLPEFAAGMLQSKKAREAFRHPDLNRDFAFAHKRSSYYSTPVSFDLNGVLYYNTFVNGLEELLRYADRNSMAHATEVRLPFLNHDLVHFLFTLPPHLKIHNGWTKWLLRQTVKDMLPEEIVWRKDKTGFEPPQKQWMSRPQVIEAIQAAKKKLAEHGVLNAAALSQKIKPHDAHAAESWEWRYWTASYLF